MRLLHERNVLGSEAGWLREDVALGKALILHVQILSQLLKMDTPISTP